MIAELIKNTHKAKLDLHTHSNFCDGKSSAEEMVRAAIKKGLSVLGIVTHAYIPFEDFYTIHPGKVGAFQQEIRRLSDVYKDKITLLCGVEADPVSTMSYEGFSYILGSSHYFGRADDMRSVDMSPESFKHAVSELFNGDVIAAADNYYQQLTKVAELNPDIIGHFDLVTKFNEKLGLIDEQSGLYRCAWQKAADELLKLRVPFEINTGGITRGWKTSYYPSDEILRYLEGKGAQFVISSDAHRLEQVGAFHYKFND